MLRVEEHRPILTKPIHAAAAKTGMSAALYPSSFAVSLIGLYQRFISPYKGFRCAHRARRQGRTSSCSQFAKRAIARLGVLAGWPLIERRFSKCSASARVLDYEPRRDKKRSSKCDPASGCDGSACDLGASACELLPEACAGVDVPACDCSL